MKNAFIFAVAFATVAFAANKFGGVGLAVSSETYGLRVNAVVDGSPAAEAGVQENDLRSPLIIHF